MSFLFESINEISVSQVDGEVVGKTIGDLSWGYQFMGTAESMGLGSFIARFSL